MSLTNINATWTKGYIVPGESNNGFIKISAVNPASSLSIKFDDYFLLQGMRPDWKITGNSKHWSLKYKNHRGQQLPALVYKGSRFNDESIEIPISITVPEATVSATTLEVTLYDQNGTQLSQEAGLLFNLVVPNFPLVAYANSPANVLLSKTGDVPYENTISCSLLNRGKDTLQNVSLTLMFPDIQDTSTIRVDDWQPDNSSSQWTKKIDNLSPHDTIDVTISNLSLTSLDSGLLQAEFKVVGATKSPYTTSAWYTAVPYTMKVYALEAKDSIQVGFTDPGVTLSSGGKVVVKDSIKVGDENSPAVTITNDGNIAAGIITAEGIVSNGGISATNIGVGGGVNDRGVALKGDGGIVAKDSIQVGDENSPAVSLDSNGKVVAKELNIADATFSHGDYQDHDWSKGLCIKYGENQQRNLLFQKDGSLSIRDKDGNIKFAAGTDNNTPPYIYIGETRFYEGQLNRLLDFLDKFDDAKLQQLLKFLNGEATFCVSPMKHPGHALSNADEKRGAGFCNWTNFSLRNNIDIPEKDNTKHIMKLYFVNPV